MGRPKKEDQNENSAFMNFRLQSMHPHVGMRNDIIYKGNKIYKFEAFAKFGSYSKMMADRNVKIVTRDNPIIN